ncbi:MAG TPA: secondary thiamine-phosphate synthase enzyme YjbQ [Syntrophomonadaceae bacterium]|nr:secondary thiamine-phosphate synthase enzyme YjbQ [Syntrophomonadaceae bacterium]
MFYKCQIETGTHNEMIDITRRVWEFIQKENIRDGTVTIYCPHTTAGITINENADPNVVHDLLMRWDEVYPLKHPGYLHVEGNSAAHLKASTIGASQTIPVVHGDMVLGTWQGIYLCEFDGPRARTFFVKLYKE